MCGILGTIRKDECVNKDLFSRQLNIINHRGPDDNGVWFNKDGYIALGSVRLAILDLSDSGHMPMQSPDGRFVIVYNGEIYNHLDIREKLKPLGYEFRSMSDTETVLYAYMEWGIKALDHFVGMFAIAILDNRDQQLFLARDRAGEKPLYFWKYNKGFSFSSELKQLLLDDNLLRKLNKKALKKYLEDGFLNNGDTFIDGVFKLQSGHYLLYNVSKNSFIQQEYWRLPLMEDVKVSDSELLEKLDILLSNAVERQLISDVPLGILLSGGVDSSLVTSYAVEHSRQKVKTFHISFEGFGKYDEAEYAQQVAEYFGTEHIELSGNDIKYEMIDEILNYYDEPLGDSSMLPTYLVSALTKKYVTVALGGDGGDELFGGYTTYSALLKQQNTWQKVPNIIRKGMSNTASFLPVGYKGRNFLKNLPGDCLERFGHNRLFDAESISNLLSLDGKRELQLLQPRSHLSTSGNLINDMGAQDFTNYLPEDILIKVDRASMAHSLEMRAPFLDRDVIEFAFTKVPDHLKVTKHELKILPKRLLQKQMPVGFNMQRKQGFSIPLNAWIANKWYDKFMNEIQNNLPEFLNKDFALSLCRNIKKGYSNSSRLYAILILTKWIKKFNINF